MPPKSSGSQLVGRDREVMLGKAEHAAAWSATRFTGLVGPQCTGQGTGAHKPWVSENTTQEEFLPRNREQVLRAAWKGPFSRQVENMGQSRRAPPGTSLGCVGPDLLPCQASRRAWSCPHDVGDASWDRALPILCLVQASASPKHFLHRVSHGRGIFATPISQQICCAGLAARQDLPMQHRLQELAQAGGSGGRDQCLPTWDTVAVLGVGCDMLLTHH